MEFLYEYGLFLAKTLTFVIAIAVIIGLAVSAGQKAKDGNSQGTIEVTALNERYEESKETLKAAIYEPEQLKLEEKEKKKKEKADKKAQKQAKKIRAKDQDAEKSQLVDDTKKRIFVLNFDGDIKASAVDNLREEITAILTLATTDDEIVVRLESAGGMVHGYGLAASQLARIRAKEIPLTVCIDKVAASGGYMMACVANTIYSAPFAIIGSIGVVAQLPNFHRLLKKHDVDFELLTAGEYKRTLTMFGENTDKGRQKFIEELDNTHDLFKQFVAEQRPVIDIASVATGEVWFGREAKDKQLVDNICTSDDYLMLQSANHTLYQVQYVLKKSFQERIGMAAQLGIEGVINKVLNMANASRFLR